MATSKTPASAANWSFTPSVESSPGEVILVRHGETLGQSSIRLYGHTDIELSEIGWQQMKKVESVLSGQSFQQIIASPLGRSYAPAEMIRQAYGSVAKLRVIEAFREINFGHWESWTYEEARVRDPQNFQQWKLNRHVFNFPGGETKHAFRTRVLQAVNDDLFPIQQRTLAILHKGIIKILITAFTGLSEEAAHQLPVFLGSIHRLRYSAQGWYLHTSNEITHLGDLLIEEVSS